MLTLTAQGCRARRERLWKSLQQQPDWIIIADLDHVNYFSGYFPSPFVFRTNGSTAILLLGANGESVLVADNLVEPFADAAHVDRRILPVWYNGQESAGHRKKNVINAANEYLDAIPLDRIGVELSSVPTGIIQPLQSRTDAPQILALDEEIMLLRRSKFPDEVALIRAAIHAGEAAHQRALALVRPGMTEMDVYRLLVDAAVEDAGEPVTVYGDVVSGPRTEQVGGPPTDRVIKEGDLVILDFSVILRGYRGDFTNTFVCGGDTTEIQKTLFSACLQALCAAQATLKPGTACKDIDATVRSAFRGQGLEDTFVTHSGHGIGLGHPDAPYLVPNSNEKLIAGDVIAIEPGQYVSGVGGMRIEHNYLITPNGFDRLTNHALQLEQVNTNA